MCWGLLPNFYWDILINDGGNPILQVRPILICNQYQAWRAGSQPASPSTNLGVTGHPGPAAEARLVAKIKLAHIYTRLDAAPGGSLSADPWPGLAPGGPAASQHRPTSDGSAEAPCHSKAEKLISFCHLHHAGCFFFIIYSYENLQRDSRNTWTVLEIIYMVCGGFY